MHDLDRTFLELGTPSDPTGAIASEFWSAPPTPSSREVSFTNGQPGHPYTLGQAGHPYAGGQNGHPVFDEMTEMELASELLGAQSDQEMDHFLGGLLKKAEGFLGRALHSTVGREILGQLKNLAKTALPAAGAALGNYLLPGVGGTIGRTLATDAGKAMGLELEGLSPADQEFEVARRVVRLGAQAARQAAVFNPSTPAEATQVARAALAAAAREVAPGLLRNQAVARAGTEGELPQVRPFGMPVSYGPQHVYGSGVVPAGENHTGTWRRIGPRRIVLDGV